MTAFDKHERTLEVHETMMGTARGRLAVAMDLLTDALAMVEEAFAWIAARQIFPEGGMGSGVYRESIVSYTEA